MPLHVRFEGDVAILSNLGRSMNDPRYPDAAREVRALLDEGYRKFVLELRGVQETGSPLLGVMITLTREIRQQGGEIVLAGVGRGLAGGLEEMQLQEYWSVYRHAEEARRSFA
jgi:anti-anti-sigma regulatory factor